MSDFSNHYNSSTTTSKIFLVDWVTLCWWQDIGGWIPGISSFRGRAVGVLFQPVVTSLAFLEFSTSFVGFVTLVLVAGWELSVHKMILFNSCESQITEITLFFNTLMIYPIQEKISKIACHTSFYPTFFI